MGSSPWIPLAQATDPERCGNKASTLARLLGEGLPVLPGWVLPVGGEPDVTPLLDQPVRRWLLRSSSPLEDRPGRSAAGWFLSLDAVASPDELRRALERVLASARDPRLVRLLGSQAPLAVLAQPHLRLQDWCAVECRGAERWYEGWSKGGTEALATASHPLLDPVVDAAVEATRIDPALLELGIDEDGPWLLQIRPAPSRAPSRTTGRDAATAAPAALHPGLGVPVHPGDEDEEWRADLEHCPTPLSVLLATTFGRWIASDPSNSPSRIIDGRWHDAVGPRPAPDRGAATSEEKEWRRRLDECVRPALRSLRQRHDALERTTASWQHFLDAWLGLQREYFAMETGAARRFARSAFAGTTRRPGLAQTPAADRLRRWARLRARVLEVLPAPSAEAIARWANENPDHPLAVELAETARRDRAVAVLPYDGFSPGLDEDPWPLYRSLATEIRVPEAAEPATGGEELAARILALAESDNELLLEGYALWRSAIRRLAGPFPAARLHALGIADLEAWLSAGGDPPDPAPGRALHAAWSIALALDDATSLQGRPAAGGKARGPVRIARSLLEIESGPIAVVDTLGPADAIAVPRFEAIVCAAGDVLGHASVLCREFGIPCVVGVAGARERLARATEVLVDGDRGIVLDLSAGGDRA